MLLIGCGEKAPSERDLRLVMEAYLNDPKSLELRDTKTYAYRWNDKGVAKTEQWFCGDLHFKNAMGGFGPWVSFNYSMSEGKKYLVLGALVGHTDFNGNGTQLLSEMPDKEHVLKALQQGLPVDEALLKASIPCGSNDG